MKFRIPQLKSPNTLLTIWWGVAMMAAGAAILLQSQHYAGLFPQRYVIVASVLSYFLAVQVFITRLAIKERQNLGNQSLFTSWLNVMEETHSLQLSLLIPMLSLPMMFSTGSHEFPIDRNIIELLIAPGRYAGDSLHPSYIWIFLITGLIVVYLHLQVLRTYLIILGLSLSGKQIMVLLLILPGLVVGINRLSNELIEAPMIRVAPSDGQCRGEEYIAPNDVRSNCSIYWTYRNVNRLVETLEYSFYGVFTGGMQFANLLRSPVGYYTGYGQSISLEFLRNLIAGILSPSLQLFFIMRYLKKRGFEKAKRG